MPSHPIRYRLLPFKILCFLLYTPEGLEDCCESIFEGRVRVTTGNLAKRLRMQNSQLWEALWWLKDNHFVLEVHKEQKRGTVIIDLMPSSNLGDSRG